MLILQAIKQEGDIITILGSALLLLIISFAIIRTATQSSKVIANQEETIRLLKKIAGEPDDKTNIDDAE